VSNLTINFVSDLKFILKHVSTTKLDPTLFGQKSVAVKHSL